MTAIAGCGLCVWRFVSKAVAEEQPGHSLQSHFEKACSLALVLLLERDPRAVSSLRRKAGRSKADVGFLHAVLRKANSEC